MPYTKFVPEVHGFQFANEFVNHVLWGKITTYGRCGGMAYLSLDYYFAGLPVPSARTSDFSQGVPPDGSWLADRTMDRLYTSFFQNAGKWIAAYPALSAILCPFGVAASVLANVYGYAHENLVSITKAEIKNLRRWIDQGVPVPLGLVYSANLSELGQSHQVVAHGYEIQSDGRIRVAIYDNNIPGQSVYLTTHSEDPQRIIYDAGEFQAFFVSDGYRSAVPVLAADSQTPYVDFTVDVHVTPTGPLDGHQAGKPLTVAIVVKNVSGSVARHNGLCLMFWGPQGVFRDDLDGPKSFAAGETHRFERTYPAFGVTPGDCWISARYVPGWPTAVAPNDRLVPFPGAENHRPPNLTKVTVRGFAESAGRALVSHSASPDHPVQQIAVSFRPPTPVEQRLQTHIARILAETKLDSDSGWGLV